LLSAVTAWEIALLVDTSRIELDIPTEAWIERFLARPGIAAVPLSHQAACRSYRLHHLEHRDPADRLLIATAIERPWSPTMTA
jgi:PIN domain nuclease of toxin-antitoxin system